MAAEGPQTKDLQLFFVMSILEHFFRLLRRPGRSVSLGPVGNPKGQDSFDGGVAGYGGRIHLVEGVCWAVMGEPVLRSVLCQFDSGQAGQNEWTIVGAEARIALNFRDAKGAQ